MVSTSATALLPDGGRFVALDSWRGIAALAVVLYHIKGPALSGPLHDNLYVAVDFFFVLSGFVISAAYRERLRNGFPVLRYMLLRCGRIWPLHAVMVGTYLLLEIGYAAMAGEISGPRVPFTGDRELLALPAALSLLQAYVYPARPLWNVQSWSISVEIGLYLVAAWLWRAGGKAATAIAVAAAIIALLLLWAVALPQWSWLWRGIGGFGLGMAAWSLIPKAVLPAWVAATLEIALPAAALAAIASAAPLFVCDLMFAAVVLVFAREAGPVSRFLRTPPFVWLGVLSYALYMVHGLVIGRVYDLLSFGQRQAGSQWVVAGIGGQDRLLLSSLPAAAVTVAMLLLSLAAAWLAWRFVEWPAREWSRRRAARLGVAREEAQAPPI